MTRNFLVELDEGRVKGVYCPLCKAPPDTPCYSPRGGTLERPHSIRSLEALLPHPTPIIECD